MQLPASFSYAWCSLPAAQKLHVDDDKDDVPGSTAGIDREPAVAGADGVERQQASVSGIMSSADFDSLNLTENSQKVRAEGSGGADVGQTSGSLNLTEDS